MSLILFSAVLFAALLHAIWNALIKVSGDRLVTMAVTTVFASVLVTPLLFLLPLPAPESWPFLFLSTLLHTSYMLLLVKAYEYGDFAQIYPLSRGSAPLLTALLGFLLLRESMHVTEMLGMLLIVTGIFGVTLERSAGERKLSRPALIYSLLTGLSISAYSIVDGTGARLSTNSHSFTAWMFFLDGFLVPLVAYRKRSRVVLMATIKTVWRPGILVALLSTIAYAIIVWAFTQERIAPVAVLRETSVLFAMLISIFLIKEGFSLSRIGVVLLILSGLVLLGI